MIQALQIVADAAERIDSQINWEDLRNAMITFAKAIAIAKDQHN